MGRVIKTASTGKTRRHLRRTIAELLRRLSQKSSVDADVKNMVAMIVFCLLEIDEGIQSSARAWEKRDYWIKADKFRHEWQWVNDMADDLTTIIVEEQWNRFPNAIMKLIPHFTDINVARLTRSPHMWADAHNRLLNSIDDD